MNDLAPALQKVLDQIGRKQAMQTSVKPVESKRQQYVLEDGEPYVNPGLLGIVSASEKLLAINRGLTEPDDRDSLQFKRIHGTNDMIKERIVRDAGQIRKKMMQRLAKMKSLKGVHAGYFDPYVEGQLVGNPLSSPLEEINPMHLVENARRMTLMGPGGIGSEDALTSDMQDVHSSQFGFISSIEGPESSKAGIDTRAAYGTKMGSNGRLYQRFYDRRKKRFSWMSPEDMDGMIVKLPD